MRAKRQRNEGSMLTGCERAAPPGSCMPEELNDAGHNLVKRRRQADDERR